MKSRFVSAAAFLLSLAAGKFLVTWSLKANIPSPASSASVAPAENPQKLKDRSTVPGSARMPSGASALRSYIAWERKMWQMEPGRLADEFAAEVPTAVNVERLARMLAIWQERDPDGFIHWAEKQPDVVFLPSAGFYFGMSDVLMAAATRKDPEFAWSLAARTSVNPIFADTHRGSVIGSLLRQDPGAARAFIKKHQNEIAAFGSGSTGWYGLDPQKVTPAAMELPAGPVRTSIIRELARYYGSRADTVAAAGEWFRSLPAEHRREVSKLPAGGSFYRISSTHQQKLTEVWTVSEDQ